VSRTCACATDTLPNVSDTPVIIENGVRLKLNIIDTPGYGDLINNEGCWDPIVKYVSYFFGSPSSHLDQGPALGLPPQGADRDA
jgi:hypothetical protein